MGWHMGPQTERRILELMADGLERTAAGVEEALECTSEGAIRGLAKLCRQQKIRATGKFSWWTIYKITLGGRERLDELNRPKKNMAGREFDPPIIPTVPQQWFDVLQQRSS